VGVLEKSDGTAKKDAGWVESQRRARTRQGLAVQRFSRGLVESRAMISSRLNGGYMTKRLSLIVALSAILVTSAIAQTTAGQRTIQVDINYTGSGHVDASHKIYVALWDSADLQNGTPVAVKSLDSKKGTVTFSDVQKVPAYVSAAFDPTGSWTAQSAPPKGSSLGMYSEDRQKPEPIDVAAGKTVKVGITFDDSVTVH
jgi:hypothetical protein